MKNQDFNLLRQNLAEYFDLSELNDLCLNLGFSRENIAGQTRTDLANGLVEYCYRRNLIPALISLCQEKRPHVPWGKVSTGIQAVSSSSKAESSFVSQPLKNEKKGRRNLVAILLVSVGAIMLLCCSISYAVSQGIIGLFNNEDELPTTVIEATAVAITTQTEPIPATTEPATTVPATPTQTTAAPTLTAPTETAVALAPAPTEDSLAPLQTVPRSCQEILEAGQSQGDGTYTIDADGPEGRLDPFEVYCDMTHQGGGWTLFAYHTDGIKVFEVENVTITETGVLQGERWRAIRDNITTGMMFIDEFGKVSRIDLDRLNEASCQLVQNPSSLLPIEGSSSHVWHDEDSGCNVGGRDYSMVILEDSTYTSYRTAGASLYQWSEIKFNVWGYPSDVSYSYQNEMYYYIK